ncbi:MAG: biopolymer transporter ExbD [Longimicrobiales bacterium]|nr:biopolymer transporter ExbD [Longimicrobiales bacterium]
MAVLQKKSKVSDEIPSSSMADIAFLLLIFFLVTTVFPKDKGLAIVLPEPNAEEQEINPKNLMFFLVQPNGQIDVKRGESEQIQVITAQQVEGVWRTDFAQNANLIAVVQTHPESAYRHMINVLDALQSAGADKISLQVQELN